MVDAQRTGNNTAHEEIDLGIAEPPTYLSPQEENVTSSVPRIPYRESAATSSEPLITAEDTESVRPIPFINRILPAAWWPKLRKRTAGEPGQGR
jgi:hypothetical protein